MLTNFVAEIGINHNGDPEIAKRIATELSGYADFIKLQHMHPRDYMSAASYAGQHPVTENSFGETYGAHKEVLYFGISKHADIAHHVRSLGMGIGWSAWNTRAVDEVISLDPDYIKIPSCLCNHFGLIKHAARHPVALHVSFGMTDQSERLALAIELAHRRNCVFYDSTSDYSGRPTPVFMTELPGASKSFHLRGFSCHVPSPTFGVAAAAIGFAYVEYHVTLDRSMKGTDHKISLTVDEFRRMVDDARRIEFYRPGGIAEHEKEARQKLWRTE